MQGSTVAAVWRLSADQNRLPLCWLLLMLLRSSGWREVACGCESGGVNGCGESICW